MCGRYASSRGAADLSEWFEAVDRTAPADPGADSASGAGGAGGAGAGPGLRPRYNLAPTDPAPVVLLPEPGAARELVVGRWGFLPPWADDPAQGGRMINARAETVATSRAYGAAYASRRALVPVDGWYEWRRLPGGGKQPYFLTPADGSVLALAGLWTRWGRRRLLTFTVVTTAATGALRSVHDRMPLVLPPERWQDWLTGDSPSLAPAEAHLAGLELRPVGAAVGNVRNDGPQLVARVDVDGPAAVAEPTLF